MVRLYISIDVYLESPEEESHVLVEIAERISSSLVYWKNHTVYKNSQCFKNLSLKLLV